MAKYSFEFKMSVVKDYLDGQGGYPEWCVQSLLEMNNLSEEVFDNNLRLKKVMEKQGNY